MEQRFDSLLCSRWGSFLIMGIFLAILGTFALGAAFITTMASIIFFGILFLASGIALLVHSFWTAEWRGFFTQLLVGILSVVVGWLMIAHPMAGAVSITLLLAAFFTASGLFKTTTALIGHAENWGWQLFNGLVTLALGILIFAQWPAASLWVIGLFIGVDLIISGWANIAFAFILRKECPISSVKPTQV